MTRLKVYIIVFCNKLLINNNLINAYIFILPKVSYCTNYILILNSLESYSWKNNKLEYMYINLNN